jgi:hypothetical protein
MEPFEAIPVGGASGKKTDNSLSFILKVAHSYESSSTSPSGVCYFFYVASEG